MVVQPVVRADSSVRAPTSTAMRPDRRGKDAENLIAGVAAGVAAGLAASFVMEGFQQIWTVVAVAIEPAKADLEEDDPATVKVADRIANVCTGTDVPKHYRPLAGALMHYGLGAVVGGAYGAASEQTALATAGEGLIYGAALWLVLDEGLLPAAGLTKKWDAVPADTHVYALISHLVFGVTLEMVRGGLRRLGSKTGRLVGART